MNRILFHLHECECERRRRRHELIDAIADRIHDVCGDLIEASRSIDDADPRIHFYVVAEIAATDDYESVAMHLADELKRIASEMEEAAARLGRVW